MPSFGFRRLRSRRAASATADPSGDAAGADGGVDHGPSARWSWLGRAVLLVLERPALVPVALAGFLVRGGIVVLLLPIVVLPTPVGLATIFGPDIVSVALAGPNPGIVRLVLIGAAVLLAWLVVGGLVGAAADVAVVAAVTGSERVAAGRPSGAPPSGVLRAALQPGRRPVGRWLVLRVAAVRWLAHLPLAVAVAWGVVRIVEATYAELVLPSDTATPLVLRVLAASPDAVVGVLATWLLGEAWGGWAARFVILDGRRIGSALWTALRWFVQTPGRGLAAVLATSVGLGLGLAGSTAASATVWSVLRPLARIDPGELGAIAAIVLLVGVWLVGVVVVGVVVAWRAVVWTLALAAR
jgi:hypothetical protein